MHLFVDGHQMQRSIETHSVQLYLLEQGRRHSRLWFMGRLIKADVEPKCKAEEAD